MKRQAALFEIMEFHSCSFYFGLVSLVNKRGAEGGSGGGGGGDGSDGAEVKVVRSDLIKDSRDFPHIQC